MMKKAMIAASAALLLASVTPTFAQPEKPETAKTHAGRHQAERFNAEDRAAFTAGRIAALKAVLNLTPEQEKHWAALADVIKINAEARSEERAERREQRSEGQRPNIVESITDIAQDMHTRADRLAKVAEAAKPLNESLTDAQKRRFAIMLRETLNLNNPNRSNR